MFSEALQILSTWSSLDTWIVITAALSAMACAVPGCFLLLRRQSMMGDALSHSVLPGIVAAFLFAHALLAAGWINQETFSGIRQAAMFAGAIVIGVLAALLTETVKRLGKVEASSALGVVFTSLFALGLLVLRAAADGVDLDPDCVLYGVIETAPAGVSGIPAPAISNGVMLLINLLLVTLFFKELRLCTFDAALAAAMGFHPTLVHYVLMALTAATVVAAFESVGSILVIAMLIVPAATAHLLTDRLHRLLLLSLLIAGLSAVLGHVMALIVPPLLFTRIGFPTVVDASTAGMIAVASGLLFTLAVLFAPRYGVVSKLLGRLRLTVKIATEDVLGILFRLEEQGEEEHDTAAMIQVRTASGTSPAVFAAAVWSLRRSGLLQRGTTGLKLTARGREAGQRMVRAHRLWESYVARHFEVPEDHLHFAAERAEHFIGSEMRDELAAELDQPEQDPHGKEIPPEGS